MPTVLLATEKPFASAAVQSIEGVLSSAGYTLRKLEGYKTREDLFAAAGDVHAVIVRSDKVDGAFFDAAKNLKLVVRAGAGVDTIDLEEASKRGICVMNTPGQNSNAVAELAFGMMVMHARNRFDGSSGYELKGKVLALHGCGNVPRFMCKLAKGFEMKVIAFDPFLKAEQIREAGADPASSAAELFEKGNFVSLHIPATAETKGSINKEMLDKLCNGGVVINTARKEVMNENDLLETLKSRKDIGYLSDVIPDNLKDLEAVLGDHFSKQVFCTPKKMGAQTAEANNNAGIAGAQQIVEFFEKNDRKFQVNK